MSSDTFKKYLDPKTLKKLGRLDLVARLVVEGYITGMHKSPYHGFSVEFAEHREYVPGDDIRHVDWKVYGKSDRYYVKQYEEETDLTCYLMLDISESMRYASGPVSKLLFGKFIAATLAYLVQKQRDSVGLVLFDDDVRTYVPSSSSTAQLNQIFHQIDQARPTECTDLSTIFHTMAERFNKKGLVVIVSDMFDNPETILMGLRHLRHKKHEVILFHLLDDAELRFPFDRMTRFVGLEDMPNQLCDPRPLRKAYLKELNQFIDDLKRECRRDRIDYVQVNTSQSLDVVLSSYLATRAEMKLK